MKSTKAKERLAKLDKRLGQDRGAHKERARLHRVIQKEDVYAPIWERDNFKPVEPGHIGATENDFRGAVFKTPSDLL